MKSLMSLKEPPRRKKKRRSRSNSVFVKGFEPPKNSVIKRLNEDELRMLVRVLVRCEALLKEQQLRKLRESFGVWQEHKERMRHRLKQAAFLALQQAALSVLHSSAVGRRSEEQIQTLVEYCYEMENLASRLTRDKTVLAEFCQHARLLALPDHSLLFLQGQAGHDFYILVSGSVKLFVYATKEGDEFPLLKKLGKRAKQIQGLSAKPYYQHLGKHVYTNQEGQGFGEVSLQTDKPRDATAVCEGAVKLMIIPKQIYLRALPHKEDERTETKEKHEFLSSLTLLSDWPPSKIHRFAYKMQRREFPRRAVIASIGDELDEVFLIYSGEVSIKSKAQMKLNKILKEKKEAKQSIIIEVGRASTGFIVGDYEAIHRVLIHQNTITCCTSVVAYSMDANEFVAFFASSTSSHTKVMETVALAQSERARRVKREVRRQWELRERLAAHCRAHPPTDNPGLNQKAAVPAGLARALRRPAAPAPVQTDKLAYQSMQAWTVKPKGGKQSQGWVQPRIAQGSLGDLPTLFHGAQPRPRKVSHALMMSKSAPLSPRSNDPRRPSTSGDRRASSRPSIVSFIDFSTGEWLDFNPQSRRPSSAFPTHRDGNPDFVGAGNQIKEQHEHGDLLPSAEPMTSECASDIEQLNIDDSAPEPGDAFANVVLQARSQKQILQSEDNDSPDGADWQAQEAKPPVQLGDAFASVVQEALDKSRKGGGLPHDSKKTEEKESAPGFGGSFPMQGSPVLLKSLKPGATTEHFDRQNAGAKSSRQKKCFTIPQPVTLDSSSDSFQETSLFDVVKQAHNSHQDQIKKIDEWNRKHSNPTDKLDAWNKKHATPGAFVRQDSPLRPGSPDSSSPGSPSSQSSVRLRPFFPENQPRYHRMDSKVQITVASPSNNCRPTVKLPSPLNRISCNKDQQPLFQRQQKNDLHKNSAAFCSTSSSFYCTPASKQTSDKEARSYLVSPLQSPPSSTKQFFSNNLALPYSSPMNFDTCKIELNKPTRISVRTRLKDL